MLLKTKKSTSPLSQFILLTCLLMVSHSSGAADEYSRWPEYSAPHSSIQWSNLSRRSFGDDANPRLITAANKFLQNAPRVTAFIGHSTNYCTGVFISNQGHLLTAGHCVSGRDIWELFEVGKGLVDGREIPIQVFRSKRASEGQLLKDRFYSELAFPKKEQVEPLEIIALGEGYPNFVRGWSSSVSRQPRLQISIREHISDYAIVKFPQLPDGYDCTQLSARKPGPGEIIWGAGFPVGTQARQGSADISELSRTRDELFSDSNARSILPTLDSLIRYLLSTEINLLAESRFRRQFPLYLTIGRAYENYQQMETQFQYPLNQNSFDLISDPNKYFVSTSLMKPGFSGGGVFNTDNELVGINSMTPGTPLMANADGLTHGWSHVSAEYIRKEIRQRFGEDKALQIFNCTPNSTTEKQR